MPTSTPSNLIAVDIGNSRIKLGVFVTGASAADALPMPSATGELLIADRAGHFDVRSFTDWRSQALRDVGGLARGDSETIWLIASVHRGASQHLEAELKRLADKSRSDGFVRRLAYQDVPMPICVDAPERVGIDRLLAACAANRLRRPDRAAIVVDLGTATTVDLVSAGGEFCGGAILPGVAVSARALAEETDALPLVSLGALDREPNPVGKSTVSAIESGLYWGSLGAIREFFQRFAAGERLPPDVFLTGGAAGRFAERLATDGQTTRPTTDEAPRFRHVESLVLSGIALVHEANTRS